MKDKEKPLTRRVLFEKNNKQIDMINSIRFVLDQNWSELSKAMMMNKIALGCKLEDVVQIYGLLK